MFEHVYLNTTSSLNTQDFKNMRNVSQGLNFADWPLINLIIQGHFFPLYFLSVQFRFSSRARPTSGICLIDQQSLLFLLHPFFFLEKEEQEVKIAEGVGHILKW